jgi:sugar phosphate isomerase/epimerase
MSIHLSCSTICFRNSSIVTALWEIQGAGFTRLDLAVIPGFCDHFDAVRRSGAEREDFVGLIRNSGFEVPTVTAVPGHFNEPGVLFEAIFQAALAYLKLTALLGADALNLHCGLPIEDRRLFRDEAILQARGLKRIAQEAGRMGLRINIEAPHRNGLCRTLEEAEFLMERISEPNVFFLLDVTHVQAGGASPVEAVRRFRGRIGHVHLRDGEGENIFLVPGEGDIDFRAFFEELERSDYHGLCALELEGCGESLAERRACLHRALDHLVNEATSITGLARAASA